MEREGGRGALQAGEEPEREGGREENGRRRASGRRERRREGEEGEEGRRRRGRPKNMGMLTKVSSGIMRLSITE